MITYKANAAGTLSAAYIGTCRIGYVEVRQFNRWRWQLSLVMPGGGNAFGVEDDEESAREQITAKFKYWLASAGLKTEEASGSQRDGQTIRFAQRADDEPDQRSKTGKPRPKSRANSVRKRKPAS